MARCWCVSRPADDARRPWWSPSLLSRRLRLVVRGARGHSFAAPTRFRLQWPGSMRRWSQGFLAPQSPGSLALRTWLGSWAGIGRIAVGMAHQGFGLQLTRYDERGWCATFYIPLA